jgi:molecular chaperone GrpE
MPKDGPNMNSESELNEEKPELITHPSYEEVLVKLDETEKKMNQYWERILRMQADNENALRRHERDVANAHKYALEKFVNELLPIVDSLELCTSNAAPDSKGKQSPMIEGVNLTLKMFYTALDKFGVKQINPVGEVFEPEHQQAISTQYDPDAKAGTVLSVLQKGYSLNNRLIRPALVVVAKAEK